MRKFSKDNSTYPWYTPYRESIKKGLYKQESKIIWSRTFRDLGSSKFFIVFIILEAIFISAFFIVFFSIISQAAFQLTENSTAMVNNTANVGNVVIEQNNSTREFAINIGLAYVAFAFAVLSFALPIIFEFFHLYIDAVEKYDQTKNNVKYTFTGWAIVFNSLQKHPEDIFFKHTYIHFDDMYRIPEFRG